MGGSPLPDVAAEFNGQPHVRGTVSAARASDPNSANSQFFITFSPRFSLDGKYSVFGRVISGMQYVDAIARGEPPPAPTRIVKASIGADNLPPPTRPKSPRRCSGRSRRRRSSSAHGGHRRPPRPRPKRTPQ